jgi:hypothetical protein
MTPKPRFMIVEISYLETNLFSDYSTISLMGGSFSFYIIFHLLIRNAGTLCYIIEFRRNLNIVIKN